MKKNLQAKLLSQYFYLNKNKGARDIWMFCFHSDTLQYFSHLVKYLHWYFTTETIEQQGGISQAHQVQTHSLVNDKTHFLKNMHLKSTTEGNLTSEEDCYSWKAFLTNLNNYLVYVFLTLKEAFYSPCNYHSGPRRTSIKSFCNIGSQCNHFAYQNSCNPMSFLRILFYIKKKIERITLGTESDLCHFHTIGSLCQDHFDFLFCPPKSLQIFLAWYHY